MKCPHCQKDCTSVVQETRKQDGHIIRGRLCGYCEKRFYSREAPDITIVLRRSRPDKRPRQDKIEAGVKVTSLAAFQVWR